MAQLRIGFIGAGANTRSRHIPGLAAVEGVELVGVANRSRESGQKVADEFGLTKVYDSPEALLADPDIDAVCIGTWPYMHKDFSIAALEAGKHVLCEARMAMDLPEAEEMLAAAQRHPDLVAQLVPAPMDLKSGPTIARLIREGALGDVREVSVNVLNGGGLNASTPIHWRQQMKYSGRNIMTYGIQVEIAQRWVGDMKDVAAAGSIYTAQRPDGESGAMTAVDIPDTLTATGELANGAHYTFRVSSVAAGAADNGITVYGSKATIRWAPNDTATMAKHGEQFEPITVDAGTDRGWRVEDDFVDSVWAKKPVRYTSFQDGVRYMRQIDATWRSINEGRRIVL